MKGGVATMFNDIQAVFRNCFDICKIYREQKGGLNEQFFETSYPMSCVAENVLICIQEKTTTIKTEGLQHSEAGTYVVKTLMGYTGNNVDVQIGDIIEKRDKRYKVVNILNKQDFLVLVLQEVDFDG